METLFPPRRGPERTQGQSPFDDRHRQALDDGHRTEDRRSGCPDPRALSRRAATERRRHSVELYTRDFSGLPLPSLTVKVAKGRVMAFTLYGPHRGF